MTNIVISRTGFVEMTPRSAEFQATEFKMRASNIDGIELMEPNQQLGYGLTTGNTV